MGIDSSKRKVDEPKISYTPIYHDYKILDPAIEKSKIIICESKRGKQRYALRVLPYTNDKEKEKVQNEYRLHLKASKDNPFVVKIRDIYKNTIHGDKAYLLVLDLCGKDLSDRLDDLVKSNRTIQFTEQMVAHYISTIGSAIKNLHDLDIVHHNLNLHHILYSEKSNGLKLCNFQRALDLKALYDKQNSDARDVLKNRQKSIDMLGIGMIMYILLTGKLDIAENQINLDQDSEDSSKTSKIKIDIEPSSIDKLENVSKEAKDLLKSLLHKNHEIRIKIDELMRNPWVRKFASAPKTPLATLTKWSEHDDAKKNEIKKGIKNTYDEVTLTNNNNIIDDFSKVLIDITPANDPLINKRKKKEQALANAEKAEQMPLITEEKAQTNTNDKSVKSPTSVKSFRSIVSDKIFKKTPSPDKQVSPPPIPYMDVTKENEYSVINEIKPANDVKPLSPIIRNGSTLKDNTKTPSPDKAVKFTLDASTAKNLNEIEPKKDSPKNEINKNDNVSQANDTYELNPDEYLAAAEGQISDTENNTNVVNIDKNELMLKEKGMLENIHIQAYSKLLQKKYPDVSGLCDPAFYTHEAYKKFKPNITDKCIIILNHDTHWFTISNIGCEKGTWYLFDSLYSKLKSKQKKFLSQFFKRFFPEYNSVIVKIPSMQKQSGNDDCGLFCLVYATVLCERNYPQNFNFLQSKLRSFYNDCITNNEIDSTIDIRNLEKKKITEETYCLDL